MAQSTTGQHTLYLLPGLGADGRAFQYLELDPSINTIILEHTIPHKGELMEDYAQRIAQKIDTSQSFSLLGCSLGGMVAVEISKILNPEKIIIVNSIKGEPELAGRYRFFRRVPLYKIMSGRFLQKGAKWLRPLFEPESKDFYEMHSAMQDSQDPLLLPRAIHCIVHWKNQEVPQNLLHIHGTKDHVLPYKKVRNVMSIDGGSHMMIMTHAADISKRVNAFLLNTAPSDSE